MTWYHLLNDIDISTNFDIFYISNDTDYWKFWLLINYGVTCRLFNCINCCIDNLLVWIVEWYCLSKVLINSWIILQTWLINIVADCVYDTGISRVTGYIYIFEKRGLNLVSHKLMFGRLIGNNTVFHILWWSMLTLLWNRLL